MLQILVLLLILRQVLALVLTLALAQAQAQNPARALILTRVPTLTLAPDPVLAQYLALGLAAPALIQALLLFPALAQTLALAPALASTLALILALVTTLLLALLLAPAHSVGSNPFPKNTIPTAQAPAPPVATPPAAVAAAITLVNRVRATVAFRIHLLSAVITLPMMAAKLAVRLPNTRLVPMAVALAAGWTPLLGGLLPHKSPMSGAGPHLQATLGRKALERWSSLLHASDA